MYLSFFTFNCNRTYPKPEEKKIIPFSTFFREFFAGNGNDKASVLKKLELDLFKKTVNWNSASPEGKIVRTTKLYNDRGMTCIYGKMEGGLRGERRKRYTDETAKNGATVYPPEIISNEQFYYLHFDWNSNRGVLIVVNHNKISYSDRVIMMLRKFFRERTKFTFDFRPYVSEEYKNNRLNNTMLKDLVIQVSYDKGDSRDRELSALFGKDKKSQIEIRLKEVNGSIKKIKDVIEKSKEYLKARGLVGGKGNVTAVKVIGEDKSSGKLITMDFAQKLGLSPRFEIEEPDDAFDKAKGEIIIDYLKNICDHQTEIIATEKFTDD